MKRLLCWLALFAVADLCTLAPATHAQAQQQVILCQAPNVSCSLTGPMNTQTGDPGWLFNGRSNFNFGQLYGMFGPTSNLHNNGVVTATDIISVFPGTPASDLCLGSLGTLVLCSGGGGGSGTVTSVSVVTANGMAGTVANSTTTPALTLSSTFSGIAYSNGTGFSAAVASDFPLLNQSTTGNAATATALAANPTLCTVTGEAPTGILASGDATGCFTPSGSGNVSTSGTPAQYQTAVFANGTAITGIGPGTAGQAYISGGAGANPSFSSALSDVTSVNGSTIPAGQTLLYSGGPGGTPSSLTLTNATGLPNASVIGLGTFATQNYASPPSIGSTAANSGAFTSLTANTLNGDTFTAGTYTLTGSASKTLDFLNSLTFAGTDATTFTFPASSDTVTGIAATQTLTNKSIAASEINSGTLAAAQMPALTGDCTTSSGAVATTCTKTNGTLFGTFATQNYATPPVIGGTTPAAGAFTTLSSTGVLSNTNTGAASTASVSVTGTPYTGGTGTTTYPLFYINQGTAPTTLSTAGTELGFNAPSGFTGNFLDFHVNGGASVASLSSTGALTVSSCTGCGSGSGTVTTTGSPASTQLATFSGATSITGIAVGTNTLVGGLGSGAQALSPAQAIGVLNSAAANAQTGTTYTLVLGDANGQVTMSNTAANTLTIPPNSSVAFPLNTLITVQQLGTGTTSIALGAGVSVQQPGNLTYASLGGQYGYEQFQQVATNVWQVVELQPGDAEFTLGGTCTTSATSGGNTGGLITLSSAGPCTIIVTPGGGLQAKNLWLGSMYDRTQGAVPSWHESASNATTATFDVPTAALTGDQLTVLMSPQ